MLEAGESDGELANPSSAYDAGGLLAECAGGNTFIVRTIGSSFQFGPSGTSTFSPTAHDSNPPFEVSVTAAGSGSPGPGLSLFAATGVTPTVGEFSIGSDASVPWPFFYLTTAANGIACIPATGTIDIVALPYPLDPTGHAEQTLYVAFDIRGCTNPSSTQEFQGCVRDTGF